MAWPTDRLTTYAAGVPVKSADLNALQDAIRFGYHGPEWREAGTAMGVVHSSVSLATTAGYYAGQGQVGFDCPLKLGERFLGARIHVRDTGATISCKARTLDNAGSFADISDTVLSSGGSADETVVLTTVVATTKVAGLQVQVLVLGGAASHRIYLVEYQVDFPAP